MSEVTPASDGKQYALRVVQDTHALMEQKAVLQDVVEKYLLPTVDFGLIPGTGNKPALFKAGAEKLMDVYGLAADPVIESKIEDYDKGLFDYTIKAYIKTRDGKLTLSSALGSCSSFESKYRYVSKNRSCPECESETIFKSKYPDKKTGDLGFYCFAAKGGCGANFTSDDKRITEQETGKKERTDMADIKNTVLKMAEKRAVVAAVIRATRSAELFTQDLEDMSDYLPDDYITVEAKEVPVKGEGKPKDSAPPKSTGKKESASAVPAGGSSQQSQASAPGAEGQTTPKSPAKDAAKNQESQASTASVPGASGKPAVSDEEFASLKSGIWKAYQASGFSIEVTDDITKAKNTSTFKKILKEKFDLDPDNASFRQKLNSSSAGEVSFLFGSNPKR